MQELNEKFGYNVRTLRRALELTQQELADKSDLNRTYLVRVESGDRNVTLNTANRIAGALGTDVVTLLSEVNAQYGM